VGLTVPRQGQASDIAIHAKEILEMRARLNRILALHTRQPVPVIGALSLFVCGQWRWLTASGRAEAATERDRFFTAEEAVEFGLVDSVIRKRPDPADGKAQPLAHTAAAL
jgi:ATP-dependent Clp protease protease subunit